jgi:hypothetical protein
LSSTRRISSSAWTRRAVTHASERNALPDNRLAPIDQMSFLSVRATGQGTVVQCVWIYERAVDLDGLRRSTATSDSGCWDGGSSVLRCRSHVIGRFPMGPRRTSIKLSAPVRAVSSAHGPMNADKLPSTRNRAQLAPRSCALHGWIDSDQPGGIALGC